MSIYKDHEPANADGMFLKLKDGDKFKLRIASEPAVTTFDGQKLRYNWVVWNRDLKRPQVYGAGVSVFSQLAELVEEWGEPTDFDITIKRTGSGQFDTNYSVTPVRTSDDLTKDEQEAVKEIDLLELCKGRWLRDYIKDGKMPDKLSKDDQEAPSDPTDPGPDDNDAPIDDIPF